jgi:hypothetical protein
MKIRVRQGIIHVNSVSVMQKTDEVICLYVDTRQKWPELSAQGSGPEESEHSIYLDANERTLHVMDREAGAGPTEVLVEGLPEGHWTPVVQAGRYTVMFVLFKQGKAPEEEWGEDDWWDTKEED